ncbi:RNA polymerase sigma factor [Cyclobacteriaceae bacterium YHN15]|nr:RNA polymerase sigma factor [Cyclobacteriaceae bacterium YHN15]
MKTFFEANIWPLKNKLYRMAYLWVKDREVAEDILQSVFEKAWNRKNELQKMENPMGWMVRTLKNESLQHYRFSKRFESIQDHEPVEESQEKENMEVEVNMVFSFLEGLPDKQKEVFQLREVEGLTYEEIAGYLEISMDQVKVNLHRARKSLKGYLMTRKNEE